MSVQELIEVVDDDGDIENVDYDIANSNSNEQIAWDEDEAINQSNIMKDQRRHASLQTSNRYDEGPSGDDLP